MSLTKVEPETENLIDAIESVVCDRLGKVAMQTDFRRNIAGGADAIVIIKSKVENKDRQILLDEFLKLSAVEAAWFNQHKLALRFTDTFLTARINTHIKKRPIWGEKYTKQHIVVCFCDPNANKSLHVGHLRNIAIGSSLAALWRSLGAKVECQAVICDIGRNVAEALAGLFAAGAEKVLADSERLSPRLGEFYAAYIKKADVPIECGLEANEPIAREIFRYDDEADSILDRWREGEPLIRSIWQTMIDRVLNEQLATLERIGTSFEKIIFESSAISDASALSAILVSKGIAFREHDESVILETGRLDYARCVLSRSDGFPTEHLRALVLWNLLRNLYEKVDLVVHVMGQEWRASTEIRLDVLELLRKTDFPSRYKILPHQLVRVGGSNMKSSTGNVLLLDDLCDAIDNILLQKAYYGETEELISMQRAAVLIPMLIATYEDSIEISWDFFLDEKLNPGLRVARAIAATHCSEQITSVTPEVRFLALQCERLARMTETAALRGDPSLIVRHLLRLADMRLTADLTCGADTLLRIALLQGLSSLGWRQ